MGRVSQCGQETRVPSTSMVFMDGGEMRKSSALNQGNDGDADIGFCRCLVPSSVRHDKLGSCHSPLFSWVGRGM